MMQWAHFPRAAKSTTMVMNVVAAFEENYAIDSVKQDGSSNIAYCSGSVYC